MFPMSILWRNCQSWKRRGKKKITHAANSGSVKSSNRVLCVARILKLDEREARRVPGTIFSSHSITKLWVFDCFAFLEFNIKRNSLNIKKLMRLLQTRGQTFDTCLSWKVSRMGWDQLVISATSSTARLRSERETEMVVSPGHPDVLQRPVLGESIFEIVLGGVVPEIADVDLARDVPITVPRHLWSKPPERLKTNWRVSNLTETDSEETAFLNFFEGLIESLQVVRIAAERVNWRNFEIASMVKQKKQFVKAELQLRYKPLHWIEGGVVWLWRWWRQSLTPTPSCRRWWQRGGGVNLGPKPLSPFGKSATGKTWSGLHDDSGHF